MDKVYVITANDLYLNHYDNLESAKEYANTINEAEFLDKFSSIYVDELTEEEFSSYQMSGLDNDYLSLLSKNVYEI